MVLCCCRYNELEAQPIQRWIYWTGSQLKLITYIFSPSSNPQKQKWCYPGVSYAPRFSFRCLLRRHGLVQSLLLPGLRLLLSSTSHQPCLLWKRRDVKFSLWVSDAFWLLQLSLLLRPLLMLESSATIPTWADQKIGPRCRLRVTNVVDPNRVQLLLNQLDVTLAPITNLRYVFIVENGCLQPYFRSNVNGRTVSCCTDMIPIPHCILWKQIAWKLHNQRSWLCFR